MYSAKDPGPILSPITLRVLRQVPWWTIYIHCITLHVNYSQLSAPKDVTSFVAIKKMTKKHKRQDRWSRVDEFYGLPERQKLKHTQTINPHEAKTIPNFNPLKSKCVCNMKTQFTKHSKHSPHWWHRTHLLMLYKAKVTACSEICTQHVMRRKHDVEFLNVKPGGN